MTQPGNDIHAQAVQLTSEVAAVQARLQYSQRQMAVRGLSSDLLDGMVAVLDVTSRLVAIVSEITAVPVVEEGRPAVRVPVPPYDPAGPVAT
jgi:hypothetical protein